jgi:putative ABC transport system permease protein
MFTMMLAIRNLARNLRRTLLSMGAVIAGVFVIILGQGFIGGVEENIIVAQVDSLSGHVLVRPADYPTEGLSHPVDELWSPAELAPWLDEQGVEWAPRLMFAPRLVKGADAMRVRAVGYDVERDPVVFSRELWKIRGVDPTSGADGILVSTGVAKVLEIEPGDRVVFETRTAEGAINALEAPVAGVYAAGNSVLDRVGVFVPMDFAEELVRPNGEMSHLAVRLPRRDLAVDFAEQVRQRAPADSATYTWIDETADMIALQQIRRKALNLLVLVLMGMSATGIANTVLMAAYERIREIGTLRAMGMTRAEVVRLFVVEGGLMGLVGALAGAAAGGGLVAYWAKNPIDISSTLEQSGNLAVSALLYTQFQPATVFGAIAFGVIVAVLASIWPALVASRMPPAEAVRAD